jgi:hypothetical protein
MPAGSMAIYREATGGEDRDSTSDINCTFDTTVFEDDRVFEMQANRYDIEIKERGHYLLLGNEVIDNSSGTSRLMHHGRFVHNSNTLQGSGSGYIRMTQGCESDYVNVACIEDITSANNNLNFINKNVSTTTGANSTRRANSSGLSLLKLDDTWDYIRLTAYTGTPGPLQQLGGAIGWSTQDEYDTGSFTHDPAGRNSRIGLKSTGWYLCCFTFHAYANNVPASRCSAYSAIRFNGSTYFKNSTWGTYARQTQNCNTLRLSGVCLIYNDTADDYVELMGLTSGGGAQIIQSSTHWQMCKLPDEVINVLEIQDSSGGQSMDVTQTAFDYDAETFDQSAFEHDTSTNPDNVTIKKPGPFLFIGTGRANYAPATNTRYNSLLKFRKDGRDLQYGQGGNFFRNGTVDDYGFGAALIFPYLDVDDVIDCTREDESSSSGAAPTTVANYTGMQALYLPSIFPPQGGQWIEHAY